MDRAGKMRRFRQRALAVTGALVLGTFTPSAIAAQEPRAKLVRCGTQSCLRVVGHRDDPASIVRINGHAVPAEGGRRWTAYLPVQVVRDWSAPNARTIDVSVCGPERQQGTIERVDLPIGLLAGKINLASLVVTAG